MAQGRRIVRAALGLCLLVSPVYGQPREGAPSAPSPFRTPYEPIRMSTSQPDGTPSDAPVRVAIAGAVRRPAAYLLTGRSSLAAAIEAAGGLADNAGDDVRFVRGGRIDGPYLFDPASPEYDREGLFTDGDVILIRARRGVRTAHYQTLSSNSARQKSAVQNADAHEKVHVVCVGLMEHPVVLPLDPANASRTLLCTSLLGLSPQLAETAVTSIGDRSFGADDDVLQDGEVLVFDRRLIGPADLRPVQPLPALVTPAAEPAQRPPTSAPENPMTTGALGLQPSVVPSPDGHRLTQPLPGFPFIVRDESRSPMLGPAAVAADSAASSPLQPRVLLDGGEPVDVTQPAARSPRPVLSTPPASLVTSAEFERPMSSTRFQPAARGIRSASPVGMPVRAELEGDPLPSLGAQPNGIASDETSAGAAHTLVIACLAILAGAMCLGASYLFTRKWRRQRRPAVRTTAANAAASATPQDLSNPLQDLIDGRLPVIEESVRLEQPHRLYGIAVGQKRLIVHAAHSQVAAPHFDSVATGSETRLTARAERHLAAAKASAAIRSTAGASRTTRRDAKDSPSFRYDIVEPEQPGGQAEGESHRPLPPVSQQGELLSRVLRSLRQEP